MPGSTPFLRSKTQKALAELIRTSADSNISGKMLWRLSQLACFNDKYW